METLSPSTSVLGKKLPERIGVKDRLSAPCMRKGGDRNLSCGLTGASGLSQSSRPAPAIMAEGKSVSSGSNNNPVSQLCEIPEASSTSGRYPQAPMGSRVVRTVTLVKTNRTAIKALEEGHSPEALLSS